MIKDKETINDPNQDLLHYPIVGIPYKEGRDGVFFTRRYFVVPAEPMSNEELFKTLDEAIGAIQPGLSHLRFRQLLPLATRLRGILLIPFG